MTAEDFRYLALTLPGAIESSHMNHPDFRVGGRIFATLAAPDEDHGMVKLTPEQQRIWLRKAPRAFHPASGAWGRSGATSVLLSVATKPEVRPALKAAWQNAVAKERRRAHATTEGVSVEKAPRGILRPTPPKASPPAGKNFIEYLQAMPASDELRSERARDLPGHIEF